MTVLELVADTETTKETPVQRYRRLQLEIAQLSDDLTAKPEVRRRCALPQAKNKADMPRFGGFAMGD